MARSRPPLRLNAASPKPLVRDALAWLLGRSGMTATQPELLTVVTFHRVLPEAERDDYPMPGLVVTPEELRWFLEFFQEHYTCGTAIEAHARFRAGERPNKPFLGITFDDGQLDNYRWAKPELERLGLRASFYVPTDALATGEPLWHDRLAYAARALIHQQPDAARARLAALDVPWGDANATVAGTVQAVKALAPEVRRAWVQDVEREAGGPTAPSWDGFMSPAQLRELVANGHEVGSHSVSHALLPQLDDDALARELEESKRLLEGHLDREVPGFCYPNGDHDRRVAAAVAAAGYTYAVTTSWGPNRTTTSPFRLHRCDVQSETSRSALGSLSASRMAWRLSPLFRA
ncbi:MAG: polysaccharide deacetylase family protein [Myxococcota bacterium]